jgi:general secretion pathway protein B
MSYILDALKKAEAERRVGAVAGQPASLPPSNPIQPAERKTALRTPWPWVAMTAVAAVIAAYSWLRPSPAVAPVSQQTPAPAPAPAQASGPNSKPVQPPAQQDAAIPPPATSIANEAASETPHVRARKPARPAEKKHPAEAKSVEPAAPPLPTLRELPDNIRRDIPPLTIGGYIYSGNKEDRSVIINGRLLHEGEEAAPGLTLEKMMPNGMVLNFRGHRYRSSY